VLNLDRLLNRLQLLLLYSTFTFLIELVCLVHTLLVFFVVLHHADLLLHNEDVLFENKDFLTLLGCLASHLFQNFLQVMVLFPLFTDVMLQLLVVFVDLWRGIILYVFHFLYEVLHYGIDLTSHHRCFLFEGG